MVNLLDRRVGIGLSLHPSYNLTTKQVEQDQILSGFQHEISNWQNLAAMTAGGIAYRLGKMSVYSVGAEAPLLARSLAPFIGLATEVSAFRGVHQILSSPTSPSSWLTDYLNFGTLKIFGKLAHGQNPVLAHFMQDVGMVAGHQLAYTLHLSTAPQGSLTQQFFHAESTNLAMVAGMSLGHFVTGGKLKHFEQILDLQTERLKARALFPKEGQEITALQMASTRMAANRLSESTREIQSHRDYITSLLRLSWRRLNILLQADAAEPDYVQIGDWLREVHRVQQDLLNPKIAEWRALLWEAHRQGEIDRQHLDQRIGLMDLGLSTQAKAQRVLSRTQELAQNKQRSDFEETDLKRRIQWLEALPLLSGEVPPSDIFRLPEKTLPLRAQHRREVGEILLRTFLPSFSSSDLDLYLRAAEGPVRDKSIAFDLDSTLGDTRKAYLAVADIARDPEKYDVTFDYFLHQNLLMRIPYRGIQAVLLGLWAAGNKLKLYTASENLPENHEAFFNDFPLLKVAFALVPPEDPWRIVSIEDLNEHPAYMDSLKRSRFYEVYFEEEGQVADFEKVSGLRGVKLLLRESKIPFPDFYFDLLVDDHDDPHYEMQMLGFGNRWILASSSAKDTLVAIENHFARENDTTHPYVRGWLGEKQNSFEARLNEAYSYAGIEVASEASPLQRAVHTLFETEALADGIGSPQQALLKEIIQACLAEPESKIRKQKMRELFALMESGLPEADFRKFISENFPDFSFSVSEKVAAPLQAAEIAEQWMGFSGEDSAMMLHFIVEISEGDAALISRWIKIVGEARRSGRYMPPEINAALAVARNHPAGKLLLRRIFQIFAVEDEASKLREIAALETRPEHGLDIRSLLLAGENPENIAEAINQSIHTAYMDDIRLARKVVSVMRDVSGEISESTFRERRREVFDSAFWDLMHAQKTPEVSDLFQLINLHPTAQSRLLEEQWREGKFEVVMLPGKEFDALVAEWGEVNDCSVSVFEMREAPLKDRIILREFPTLDFSSEAGIQRAYSEIVQRVLGLIHEGEHWRHFSGHYEGIETSGDPFLRGSLSRRDRLVSEMMAYLEEQRFRTRVLEVRLWEISRRMGIPLAAYLRTQAELSYYAEVNQRILRGLHLASNIP